MKVYNPKEWLSLLFFFQKSDTLIRLMPLLFLIFGYSLGVAYFELEYLKLGDKSWARHIPTMHSLLSFVISMLLVFRTNSAYDRWWEGRKLWGGLVNSSRNLALKLSAMLSIDDYDNRLFFKELIPSFAFGLKDHLQAESTQFMLDENYHPEFNSIDPGKHVPNQIARLLFSKVTQLYQDKKITGDQLIVLNTELTSFTDICGACERIKNTPIPFSYGSFIKKFILLYVLTLPMGYVFTMGYYAAPIVTFIFYVLGSLELVAEEIEEPFGKDPNDLPMEKMASSIKKHVAELL
jgi:ion channel-forming bestrophin family protein